MLSNKCYQIKRRARLSGFPGWETNLQFFDLGIPELKKNSGDVLSTVQRKEITDNFFN